MSDEEDKKQPEGDKANLAKQKRDMRSKSRANPSKSSLPRNKNRSASIAKISSSKIIGLMVLGFGVLFLLAVILMIMNAMQNRSVPQNINPTNTTQQSAQAEQQQTRSNPQSQNALSRAQNNKNANSDLSDALKDLGTRRQKEGGTAKPVAKEISESDIRGGWETILRNGTAIMEISRGTYRLIIEDRQGSNQMRYFSFGSYRIEDNKFLIFEPDITILPPRDGLIYQHIHNGPFAMQVDRDGNFMQWDRVSERISVRTGSVHPVLRFSSDPFILWKKF